MNPFSCRFPRASLARWAANVEWFPGWGRFGMVPPTFGPPLRNLRNSVTYWWKHEIWNFERDLEKKNIFYVVKLFNQKRHCRKMLVVKKKMICVRQAARPIEPWIIAELPAPFRITALQILLEGGRIEISSRRVECGDRGLACFRSFVSLCWPIRVQPVSNKILILRRNFKRNEIMVVKSFQMWFGHDKK